MKGLGVLMRFVREDEAALDSTQPTINAVEVGTVQRLHSALSNNGLIDIKNVLTTNNFRRSLNSRLFSESSVNVENKTVTKGMLFICGSVN